MKKIYKMLNKKSKGFTLVELVVVIAILAILAVIALPQLLGFQDRAREQADKQTAIQVRNATALLFANEELNVDAEVKFTVDTTGNASYTSGTFKEKAPDPSDPDTLGDPIDATTLTDLINELTGTISLQSTDKVIQIIVSENGAINQSLIPTPTI